MGASQNKSDDGIRDNPKYPPCHCFTVVKCMSCGEMFEPFAEHICRKKNSWPVKEKPDEDMLQRFYKDHCSLCGTQRCYGAYDELSRESCLEYVRFCSEGVDTNDLPR